MDQIVVFSNEVRTLHLLRSKFAVLVAEKWIQSVIQFFVSVKVFSVFGVCHFTFQMSVNFSFDGQMSTASLTSLLCYRKK